MLSFSLDISQPRIKQRDNQIIRKILRLSLYNISSSYSELFEKDNSFAIHYQNVQKSAIEI